MKLGAKEKVYSILGFRDRLSSDQLKNDDKGTLTEPTDDELSDEDIESQLKIAKNFIVEGKVEESIEPLLEIIKRRPNHHESNSLVGALLLGLKQYSFAERFLYSAVLLSNWTDVVSVVNLAESLKQSGDIELSRKTIIKSRETIISSQNASNESLAMIGEALGDSFYLTGNYSLAADLFLEVALIRRTSVESWVSFI